jgi:hypothetical protein
MHNRKSFRKTRKDASGQPWIAPFLSSRNSLRDVSLWVWCNIYQLITVTAAECFKHLYSAYHEKGTGSIPSQIICCLCSTTQQRDSFSSASIILTMFHTRPFINHGRYVVSATDSVVRVTFKKECHAYVYYCILKMFGKAQLPHNLSFPILHGLIVGSITQICMVVIFVLLMRLPIDQSVSKSI